MKKLLFKTFLMAIMACACFSLSSCGKSAQALSDEAQSLIKDDAIASENIDKAIDLFEQVVDKRISMIDDVKAEAEKFLNDPQSVDVQVIEEADLVADTYYNLKHAIKQSELSEEQDDRFKEIKRKWLDTKASDESEE